MMAKIFISYGREDGEAAKRMYRELRAYGYDPWLDTESLFPGEKFKLTIRKAIRESRYFLALLSHRSVSRKGYINKELAEALEVLEEYPASKIFLIPVRLEECQPSREELSELHRVDMFPSWDEGMRQIRKAIKLEAPEINISVEIEERIYSAEQRKEIIIRAIADDFGVDESAITPKTNLKDLGGDQLDAIYIRSRLEDEFGIRISDDDGKDFMFIEELLNDRYEGGA